MDVVIDADTPLDYIEFQISPSENRYEAYVCYLNKKEKKMSSGPLENLLLHSADISVLYSEGSDAKYKLKQPENPRDLKWFTKSTLERFLHVICSSEMLDITKAIRREMSQLEEARRFHLSLYAKGNKSEIQSGETDSSFSYGSSSTPTTKGSDASKNELLLAMDLRLTALRGELTAAFDQGVHSRYSVEEMTDLEKFSNHFGSIHLRDSLRKRIALVRNESATVSNSKQVSEINGISSKGRNTKYVGSVSSEIPVEYGASPAKVAHIERQSSSDNEESSFSSEEEQISVERSRTLIRCVSPRRSASPMRRIQIGRSGSRRPAAISIKSLNYIPTRERSMFPNNPAGSDSDEERHEQTQNKSDNNVRISVQDAIHLFEQKQKDQIGDIQSARIPSNAPGAGSKSVLRRWSSGIGEKSSLYQEESVLEDNLLNKNNEGNVEIGNNSPAAEAQSGVSFEDIPVEHCELDVKLNSPEETACPAVVQEETLPSESKIHKESSLAEWSRKTEAELNDLMMKMVETKPMKHGTVVPNSSKRRSLPAEQRCGFYDQYKEKRDEKLRSEAARKKAEKDKQFKAMQQILDSRKSELASANTGDAGKRQYVKKPQKFQKNVSQPEVPKAESPKLGSVAKTSTKASSLPATRKSWPSKPCPRAPGVSSTNIASQKSSAEATEARRSLPVSSGSRSSKKVETPQPKSVISDVVKKSKTGSTDKKQQSVTELGKITKNKVQIAPASLVSSAKPSLYSKVTKKGSVVPLESKPFLRKSSGTSSNAKPIAKIKASSQSLEPLMTATYPILPEENKSDSNSSDPLVQHRENEIGESESNMMMESDICPTSPLKCEDKGSFDQIYSTNDHVIDRVGDRELEAGLEEESTISPSAWIEIEEHGNHSLPSNDHIYEMRSPAYIAPVNESNPRVRHSLSQMLLEESNEPDVADWGIAENPPPMSFQKDVPKGFKRLLKFARKSKNDANTTGWLSPTVFSEGEEDTEDTKSVNKRSTENLVKKATLQSISNGHSKATYESYQKHPSIIGKSDAQSLSQQLHDGYASASLTTTTKATRSFFSLSAFKGSK